MPAQKPLNRCLGARVVSGCERPIKPDASRVHILLQLLSGLSEMWSP
jgi:hypothetical protein